MFNMILVPAFLMASKGILSFCSFWITYTLIEDSIIEIIFGQTKIDLAKSYERLYTEDHGVINY